LARGVHVSTAMTGFKSPEEFRAWQLAWELKERVYEITARPAAVRDGDFCDEIRKAARSAPDNISEGFYRFNPVDFANFVRMARGSLGEVRNQLKHAHSKKVVTDEEFSDLSHLCRRAIGAATGLRLYLSSLPKDFDPRRPKVSNAERRTGNAPVEPQPNLEPET
jgi:four helix bundle protein